MQCLQAGGQRQLQHQGRRGCGAAARCRSAVRLRRCVAAAQSEPQTNHSQAEDAQERSEGFAATAGPSSTAAQVPPPAPPAAAAAPTSQPAPAAAQPAPSLAPQQGYSTGYRRMSLQSFLTIDDGPPRVMSLLDPHVLPAPDSQQHVSDRRQHLPLMLYLPGVDGSGLAASRQFPSLLQRFDLRTLVTPPSDRTPFQGVVDIVVEYLKHEVPACAPTRPIYLLGESFGGLLALAVAAACPALVDRVVLVNPATSFNNSLWPVLGPLLPQVPPELYRALPLALAPVLGNPINLLAAGLEGSAGASVQQQAAQLVEAATNLLSQLPVLAEILPAETLAWKLELLRQGSAEVEPLLPRIQQRCFVLVGDQDLLIPSATEGPRLQRALPRAQLRVEKGRSHALLQEGGIDLARLLDEEGFYVRERRMSAPISKRTAAGFGVAVPIELPSRGEMQRYAESTTAFGRRLSSPVFISTAPDGTRCLGLSQIPEDRPLLLVGNHSTLALDLAVLSEQFLREQGVLLRGLAHPVIFAQAFNSSGSSAGEQGGSRGSSSGATGSADDLPAWDPNNIFGSALNGSGMDALRGMFGGARSGGAGGTSSTAGATDGRNAFREFMSTFGAVPVSAKNMHRLLQNKEAVLLFPGGVREAYKRRGEEYQLFWPEKSEFIRMAARFGATIVPFAAVGVDDSLNIIADSQQLEALPVLGDMVKRRAGGLPQARKGVAAASFEEESFVAPLAAPKLPPGRLYFLFQQPIHTSPADLQDRQRCDDMYRATKASVEEGIAWLLHKRKQDPYGEFLPRQLYEAAYRGRQAPTFPLN